MVFILANIADPVLMPYMLYVNKKGTDLSQHLI